MLQRRIKRKRKEKKKKKKKEKRKELVVQMCSISLPSYIDSVAGEPRRRRATSIYHHEVLVVVVARSGPPVHPCGAEAAQQTDREELGRKEEKEKEAVVDYGSKLDEPSVESRDEDDDDVAVAIVVVAGDPWSLSGRGVRRSAGGWWSGLVVVEESFERLSPRQDFINFKRRVYVLKCIVHHGGQIVYTRATKEADMGLLSNSRALHVQLTMRKYWTGEIYAEAYLARVKFSVQHGIMLSSACGRSSYDHEVTSASFLSDLLTPEGCSATTRTRLLDPGAQKRAQMPLCQARGGCVPLMQQYPMLNGKRCPRETVVVRRREPVFWIQSLRNAHRRRCVKQEAALPLQQQHLMFNSECDPLSKDDGVSSSDSRRLWCDEENPSSGSSRSETRTDAVVSNRRLRFLCSSSISCSILNAIPCRRTTVSPLLTPKGCGATKGTRLLDSGTQKLAQMPLCQAGRGYA
ncbi:unnamed protein product [Heligmosomoides polygyrus]|uniref:Uncharacterized protein n=1 Tax=Heligmosomoides polygyrus TaxID=6339 RepID=A0A3P7XCR7_HELPZ|nr:unnamed protein product [Heligmosomoides polygyrus]